MVNKQPTVEYDKERERTELNGSLVEATGVQTARERPIECKQVQLSTVERHKGRELNDRKAKYN